MTMGCCTDHSCTTETCMVLPVGSTCGDCAHLPRCVGLFGCKATRTTCDFFPRRFVRSADPKRLLGLAFDVLDGIVGMILITEDDRVSPEYRKELQGAYDEAHRILRAGGIDR